MTVDTTSLPRWDATERHESFEGWSFVDAMDGAHQMTEHDEHLFAART